MASVVMKGAVVAAFAIGTTVQVWVQSPTGDSSDVHIFEIPTNSEAHADTIAMMWRKTWDQNLYSASKLGNV
jgi:hypothetical protein